MRFRRASSAAAALAAVSVLSACSVGPAYRPPALQAPARFQAAKPEAAGVQQDGVAATWWKQFDDPLVAELIDDAIASSPNLAQALARLHQARTRLDYASGALLPTVDANASAVRNRAVSSPEAAYTYTTYSRSIDASWELDLFGAARSSRNAAAARIDARSAEWHVTYVSLAAEVADTLVSFRACEATVTILAQDLNSRQQTGQMTDLKIKAGFGAIGDGALSAASIADAGQALTLQRLECDLGVKALVDLTGLDEETLRAKLRVHPALSQPRGFVIDSVPARVLEGRPDIDAAERDLAAAAAEIDAAQANRYPHLSLAGSIGIAGLHFGDATSNQNTWSFGPSISLPLFDGGRRRADVDAARARYEELEGAYRQRVRSAVRELEESLLRLDATSRREADAAAAARDYSRYFEASSERFRGGNGSLFELEDARRTMLGARRTLVGVQRDRVAAWIALYKAAGGGWNRDDAPHPAP